MNSKVKIYGAKRCHKSRFYQTYFEDRKIDVDFLDVEQNEHYAEELRNIYPSKLLNFPTILIGEKRLRNPSIKDLNKWIY